MRDAKEMVRSYEAIYPVEQGELERIKKKKKRGSKPEQREKVNREGATVRDIPARNIEILIPNRRKSKSLQPTIEEEGAASQAHLE